MSNGYTFSRSRKALGLENAVRCDGWAGCPYWVAQEKGAAEPVIPPRIKKVAPDFIGVRQVVAKSKRDRRASGFADLGKLVEYRLNPDDAPTHVFQITTSFGLRWPWLVNANFAQHVENLWPFTSWRLLADGRLLAVELVPRPIVRGIVMCIRPHKLEDA